MPEVVVGFGEGEEVVEEVVVEEVLVLVDEVLLVVDEVLDFVDEELLVVEDFVEVTIVVREVDDLLEVDELFDEEEVEDEDPEDTSRAPQTLL